MPVNITTAEQFVLANARLLDRHRLAAALHGAPAEPAIQALRAYRNDDGGFGHALEPDVRGPHSEPAATLHALEVLAELGSLDDPLARRATAWLASIAQPGGALPFVLPAAAGYPRAPWMQSSGEGEGSFLTFAVTARLQQADYAGDPWVRQAYEWCWTTLAAPADQTGYWAKHALDFLDHDPDDARARQAIERFRQQIGADGCIRVPGGTEDERLTPLALSPRPGLRSRALFTQAQIDADLDSLERGQQDDGGWTFDWLAWSPGQSVEWRGIMTLRAIALLAAHGRIAPER